MLTPDIAGVIFNDDTFRADLFINPDFFESSSTPSIYLPSSDSDIGVLQGLIFNIAGNSRSNEPTYNLSADTLIGWQQEYLESRWNVTSEKSPRIRSLFWAYDNMGMHYSAGYLRSRFNSSGFLISRDIAGISFGSTDDTLLDKDSSNSTPLDIVMPDRGIVEVFKDGQLIHSELLDTGYQTIDTCGFPGGTYEVEIKITTTGGATLKSEKRIFVKQNRIKTGDQSAWFLEAGQTIYSSDSLLPDTSKQILIRAGYEHGLSYNTGVRWSLASSRNEQVSEVDFAYFMPDFSLASGLMVGLQQQLGTHLAINWNHSSTLWVSAETRRIWNSDRPEIADKKMPDLVSHQKVLDTVTVGLPVSSGFITARYSYRESPRSSDHLKSLSFQSNLKAKRKDFLRLNCSLTEADNRLSFQVSLSLSLDFNDLQHYIGSQYSEQRYKDDISRELRTTYQAQWGDINQSRQMEQRARFGVDIAKDSTDLFGTYDNTSSLGSLSLALNHERQDGSSTTGYSGSFGTSLSFSHKGVVIGGADREKSAITVSVDGSNTNDVFRVLVNEQFAGFARGGSVTTIPLSPFKSYRVKLENTDANLYEFSSARSVVTLYPGNIKHLTFKVWKNITVFGQVVDREGKAQENYCLFSREFISCSNQFGLIQTELSDKETKMTLKRNASSCSVKLDFSQAVDGFLDLGSIVCP